MVPRAFQSSNTSGRSARLALPGRSEQAVLLGIWLPPPHTWWHRSVEEHREMLTGWKVQIYGVGTGAHEADLFRTKGSLSAGAISGTVRQCRYNGSSYDAVY